MVIFRVPQARFTMGAMGLLASLLLVNLTACDSQTAPARSDPTPAPWHTMPPEATQTEATQTEAQQVDQGETPEPTTASGASGQPTRVPERPAATLEPRITNASPKTDREVLTNLFYRTGGESWDNSATWASERSLGDWEGVDTNDEGRVIKLILDFQDGEKQPEGDLLTEIHKLTELQHLQIYSKRPEELPGELGYLSELRHLYIRGDFVRGQIPAELGDLSNLVSLYIFGDALEGEVPQEIFEMPRLYGLTIKGPQLHLELSDSLESRIISGARVDMTVGTMGRCLSGLAYAWGLSIDTVTGNTRYLAPICRNVHEGDLDALKEIFNEWKDYVPFSNWLTRLPLYQWKGITIDRNGRVVDLRIEDLHDSDVRPAGLPSAIAKLTALQRLELSGLKIGGEIPALIGNLTQLEVLDLSENHFSGEIPSWIAGLTRLQRLKLQYNNLSGEVPGFLSDLPDMQAIDIKYNDLSGCLPEPPPRPEPLMRGTTRWVGPDGELEVKMATPRLRGVEYCP